VAPGTGLSRHSTMKFCTCGRCSPGAVANGAAGDRLEVAVPAVLGDLLGDLDVAQVLLAAVDDDAGGGVLDAHLQLEQVAGE